MLILIIPWCLHVLLYDTFLIYIYMYIFGSRHIQARCPTNPSKPLSIAALAKEDAKVNESENNGPGTESINLVLEQASDCSSYNIKKKA